MRATKILNAEQDLVMHFLAVLGTGMVLAGNSKAARPGFFVYSSNFIREYLEPEYLRKEEVLLQALEDAGFPADEGPVGGMRSDHKKSQQISAMLQDAAKAWQAGDEGGRAEVVWASSEYTGLMRRHFEQLRNLIHPLLDQTVTLEGEQKIAAALNRIEFSDRQRASPQKYAKIVELLEDEVNDWER